ncbi:MAG: asparagine synthase (glutamine-hydrolyzing) [Candidatus Paceibacterota bacterium]|jgi:asparagine synthase (glutamine-hydrolysing)
MCGITGFYGQGSKADLQAMNDTLIHRGPDSEGLYFENGKIGLGFRRLAIIDVRGGNQPIWNETKDVAVIFNGEIYNFQDLRNDLEKRHRFVTKTDTEVIIHLYEEVGEKCFERLNGMFAIAVYDLKKNKLVIARDRFGKKPLYYAEREGTVIFGSELKALLKHPLIRNPKLDATSLNLYLTHEFVPSPRTIYQNIFKVEPGTAISFDRSGKWELQFYFLKYNKDEPRLSETEYLEKLDFLLGDAVKKRLVSDVSLGIFLSGGLDSGAVAHYAMKFGSQQARTFSIGFDDKSFDESEWSSLTADYLGTLHQNKNFSAKEMQDLIPQVAKLIDEPVSDAALFPNYLLSKFARENVTVALAGDGGDEIFFGYPTFQSAKISDWFRKIPESLRRSLLEPTVGLLPTSFNNITLDYKLKRFFTGLHYPKKYEQLIWVGSFTPEEKRGLLHEDFLSQIEPGSEFSFVDKYRDPIKGAGELDQVGDFYLRTYLADGVLAIKDRASMMASLELRAPFLDYRLVDFAASLPTDLKMKGFNTKYLLKKLMEGKLPDEVVYRPKKGFGIPIAKWLRGELKDFMLETLSEESINEGKIFNYSFIKKLIDDHLSGKKDNRKLLWTLLVFELWRKEWLKA